MVQREGDARVYVGPLLWVAATIPGFMRIYLDQHWASDIVAGSAWRLSRNTRRSIRARSRDDARRFLLGARIVPQGTTGLSIGWTFPL